MTEEHLTFRQIEDYAAKRLPAEQIPAFFQHAESCSTCGRLVAAMASGAGVEHLAEHLAEQQAVDFIAGLLTPDEKKLVAAHLQTCRDCSEMVADLDEFRTAKKPRWSNAWVLPIAAAVLLASGAAAWLELRSGQPGVVATVQLRDAGGVLGLDRSGVLASSAKLPPGATQLLAEALHSGHLPQGPAAFPTEPHETLRSDAGSAQAGLSVVSPDGVHVLSDRPEFRWSALPGATSYRIAIFDEDFNQLAASPTLQVTAWTPTTALPRGQSLLWQCTAMRNGERVTAPAPPETFARFQVISADVANQIATALAANPPSHLLLAVLYSRAGLRAEAAAEIDLLAAANPGSPLPDSLRATLPGARQKK